MIIVKTQEPLTIRKMTKENTAVPHELPPGEHEMTRISCPTGHPCDWLVLKSNLDEGTIVGAAEGFYLQFTERAGYNGSGQITISE